MIPEPTEQMIRESQVAAQRLRVATEELRETLILSGMLAVAWGSVVMGLQDRRRDLYEARLMFARSIGIEGVRVEQTTDDNALDELAIRAGQLFASTTKTEPDHHLRELFRKLCTDETVGLDGAAGSLIRCCIDRFALMRPSGGASELLTELSSERFAEGARAGLALMLDATVRARARISGVVTVVVPAFNDAAFLLRVEVEHAIKNAYTEDVRRDWIRVRSVLREMLGIGREVDESQSPTPDDLVV